MAFSASFNYRGGVSGRASHRATFGDHVDHIFAHFTLILAQIR